MLVTLVMLATCFGLLCGIGILFGIVGLLLKFGGKVLGACATILLPIGVIWLGFKIVFAVVPLLFKLVCAALICYLVQCFLGFCLCGYLQFTPMKGYEFFCCTIFYNLSI